MTDEPEDKDEYPTTGQVVGVTIVIPLCWVSSPHPYEECEKTAKEILTRLGYDEPAQQFWLSVVISQGYDDVTFVLTDESGIGIEEAMTAAKEFSKRLFQLLPPEERYRIEVLWESTVSVAIWSSPREMYSGSPSKIYLFEGETAEALLHEPK